MCARRKRNVGSLVARGVHLLNLAQILRVGKPLAALGCAHRCERHRRTFGVFGAVKCFARKARPHPARLLSLRQNIQLRALGPKNVVARIGKHIAFTLDLRELRDCQRRRINRARHRFRGMLTRIITKSHREFALVIHCAQVHMPTADCDRRAQEVPVRTVIAVTRIRLFRPLPRLRLRAAVSRAGFFTAVTRWRSRARTDFRETCLHGLTGTADPAQINRVRIADRCTRLRLQRQLQRVFVALAVLTVHLEVSPPRTADTINRARGFVIALFIETTRDVVDKRIIRGFRFNRDPVVVTLHTGTDRDITGADLHLAV